MKVFLTGMPGCGKSTFGKRVAGILSMDFYDLDKEIIRKENRVINEIFESEGEDYFRRVESECLHEITAGHSSFILATGGGAPCFGNNMDYMNASGVTIYIRATVKELIERLSFKGLDKRPLLRNMTPEEVEIKLSDQLRSREKFYEMCRHVLTYHISMENDIAALIRSEQKS
jgi:shikimate kinase